MITQEELRVKVNGGTLVAAKNEDPDYPGIYIYYETENGNILAVVTTEVKSDHDNKDVEVYTYKDIRRVQVKNGG
jgi:hypothetical protein